MSDYDYTDGRRFSLDRAINCPIEDLLNANTLDAVRDVPDLATRTAIAIATTNDPNFLKEGIIRWLILSVTLSRILSHLASESDEDTNPFGGLS